jgi:hypothetical protein
VADPIRPFRWDLGRRAQLGSLLDDSAPPDLWFLDELVVCAARVLARSGGGDLYFVGRSMDSLYDLLTGALDGTSWKERIRVLPLSLSGSSVADLSPRELGQLRANLAADGLEPHALARRRRPVVFVDLVSSGSTFAELFDLLRGWIAEERAQWDVVRLKLRFLGITRREHTSPNTERWQQVAEWPAELPSRAIKNVSMAPDVWYYLGDVQPKATVSFRADRWLDETVREPARERERLSGLAQAVALVKQGTRGETRSALVRQMAREPTFSEPWLRALALELRAPVRGSRPESYE